MIDSDSSSEIAAISDYEEDAIFLVKSVNR